MISLPSLHDFNVKLPNFTFCRRRQQKTMDKNIVVNVELLSIDILQDTFPIIIDSNR